LSSPLVWSSPARVLSFFIRSEKLKDPSAFWMILIWGFSRESSETDGVSINREAALRLMKILSADTKTSLSLSMMLRPSIPAVREKGFTVIRSRVTSRFRASANFSRMIFFPRTGTRKKPTKAYKTITAPEIASIFFERFDLMPIFPPFR